MNARVDIHVTAFLIVEGSTHRITSLGPDVVYVETAFAAKRCKGVLQLKICGEVKEEVVLLPVGASPADKTVSVCLPVVHVGIAEMKRLAARLEVKEDEPRIYLRRGKISHRNAEPVFLVRLALACEALGLPMSKSLARFLPKPK